MGHDRQCKKCGEGFELTPTHKGFANVCEDCGGFNLPVFVAPKVEAKPLPKKTRKPITSEQADRDLTNALRGMVKLLGVLDPSLRPLARRLTSRRFNRHVSALQNIAKGGN